MKCAVMCFISHVYRYPPIHPHPPHTHPYLSQKPPIGDNPARKSVRSPSDARPTVLQRLERFWKAQGQPQAVLVPDEALGALTHESVLRKGRSWGFSERKGIGKRERDTRRTLLWADTHSTLPSTATHFSRPHCIRFGSSHWTSTCTNEQAGTVKTPSLDRKPSLDARPSPIPSALGRPSPSPMR